jgi:hypothetical protein
MKKKAKATPKQDAVAADAAVNLKAAVDKATDAGLNVAAAVEKASQPGYLNSIPAINSILVDLAQKTHEAICNADKVLPSKALEPEIKRLSGVFLGEDPSAHPLPGWNQPGCIDVWIRETTGLEEALDARAMMERVFQRFCADYREALIYATTPGVTEALWQSNMELLMHQYTYLLMGIVDVENIAPEEEEA